MMMMMIRFLYYDIVLKTQLRGVIYVISEFNRQKKNAGIKVLPYRYLSTCTFILLHFFFLKHLYFKNVY